MLRSGLIFVCLAATFGCAVMNLDPETPEDAFEKQGPRFPESEYVKGHEGWVLVGYTVTRSGLINDIGILESSGSEAFEEAAVETIEDWRFEPGAEREETALVSFVYFRSEILLSRRFKSYYDKAHGLIDKGELDAAEDILADIRELPDLTTNELAYSYLTEGRIAGARGDYERQLMLFRRAVRNDGHWLDRKNYLASMRMIVILEIRLHDYASAVWDYDALVASEPGWDPGAELEEVVESVRARVETTGNISRPYMVADRNIVVKRERHEPAGEMKHPPTGPGALPPPPTKKN